MNIESIIKDTNIEDRLKALVESIHLSGPISLQDFEELSYIKKFHPDTFTKYESKLISIMGLFYKMGNPKSLIEEIYSIFADTIEQDTGSRFTPLQADAFKNIVEKEYFSFSAPTSSGKSFLFREFILKAHTDIVIVVPSRALIAEYIYKVKNLLKGNNSILVLQFIENVNKLKTKRRIFIITPERGEELFSLIKELNIGLFLFDEAQISEERIRGMRFDSFVRRVDKLLPKVRKVFTHPFIENPEAQLIKHGFNENSKSSTYKQNTVGKIYLSVNSFEYKYFSPFDQNNPKVRINVNNDIVEEVLMQNGTLLVYISKNKIYTGSYLIDFFKYINICSKIEDKEAIEIIEETKRIHWCFRPN